MTKRSFQLLVAAACAALGALCAGVIFLKPASNYPVMEVEAPEGIQLTFVFGPRRSTERCETLLGNVSRSTFTKCEACRVLRAECLSALDSQYRDLISERAIDRPSVAISEGVIAIKTPGRSDALLACQEGERLAVGKGLDAKCYAPNVPRPGIGDALTNFGVIEFGWGTVALSLFAISFTYLFSGLTGKSIWRNRRPIDASLKLLNAQPRRVKKTVVVVADIAAVLLALWLSFALRQERYFLPETKTLWLFAVAPLLAIPIFDLCGLYRTVVRYLGMEAIWAVIRAAALYSFMLWLVVTLIGAVDISKSLIAVHGVLVLVLIAVARMIARDLFRKIELNADRTVGSATVLIYGAGAAGIQLATALTLSRETRPVAFIDDDKRLHRNQIAGLSVFSPAEIGNLIERLRVSEVLLAIPSCSRKRRAEIIELLEQHPVRVQTLPALADLAQGKVKAADLREIEIEDILGRDAVPPHSELLQLHVRGKVVMVTGAGGSIGSELCRQVIRLGPAALILLENSEYNLYAIEQELMRRQGRPSVVAILGSVTNSARVEEVIRKLGVQTIFHAAAYKHVPLVEQNPTEGAYNNIIGTFRCARIALETGVETFVLISTDKAVRPTNTMGATKRFAEMTLQAMAQAFPGKTRFTMVRFGNVLGSSGSVVPLFRQQIRAGGPITVTDPRIVRYFMTIPEAAQLVIQAGALGRDGDVFVLDMGQPIKIVDLARRMVSLSGLKLSDPEHPDGDIEIVFSGLRPGEKLYEELLIGNNVSETRHPRIMRANEHTLPYPKILKYLADIEDIWARGDSDALRTFLLEAVVEFTPQCRNEDLLSRLIPTMAGSIGAPESATSNT